MPNSVADQINTLLSSVERGTANLQIFLNESDFYTAPASRRYHMSVPGGLAQHTLNVYNVLKTVAIASGSLPTDRQTVDSLILIAICHDLCKVNFYVPVDESATSAQINFVKDLFKGRKLNPDFNKNKVFCSDLIAWAKGGFIGEEPQPRQQYDIKDDFPLGHGSKSALIASRLVDLTDDELLAIKWHSGPWEISEMEKRSYEAAVIKTPLVPLLHAADYLSTFVIEKEIV